jgi:hypothetical protein
LGGEDKGHIQPSREDRNGMQEGLEMVDEAVQLKQ